jgi:hypothetical protein
VAWIFGYHLEKQKDVSAFISVVFPGRPTPDLGTTLKNCLMEYGLKKVVIPGLVTLGNVRQRNPAIKKPSDHFLELA